MPDFTVSRSFIYIAGNIIDPAQNNTNENSIYSAHNSAFNATTGHTHDGTVGDGTPVPAVNIPIADAANVFATDNVEAALQELPPASLPPVGTITAFYDFAGALSINTTFYRFCDGTASVPISGIGNQTLPDLSNRYMVGFGTEGGGDIDTAAFATAAVGNASHQVNLAHTHTMTGHTHGMQNHTHTGPSHTHDMQNHTHAGPSHTHSVPSHFHGDGTLAIGASGSHSHSVILHGGSLDQNGLLTASNGGVGGTDSTSMNTATHTHGNSDFTGSVGDTGGVDGDSAMTSGSAGSGATGAPSNNTTTAAGTGVTGAPSNNTTTSTVDTMNSQLSATQDVQPRSIRVRFIMRIL